MSSESIRIKKWITKTLTDDSVIADLVAGRIYSRIPAKATFPLIEFGMQAGRDTTGVGGVRLQTSPLFRIKAIGFGAITSNFVSLVDRIDEIFQNKRSETFEGYVFSSRRQGEFEFISPGGDGAGDTFYTNHGGFYRIECSKNN